MTQSTPKLGLLLYDIGAPDNQATFLQFRTDLAGVTGSNFTKIDTAIAGIDSRLTNVENFKPITKLGGISTDNANYTATNENITALYDGLIVDFVPKVDNTATATLTINDGNINTINKISSSGTIVNLDARDLMAWRRYILEYDGNQWILVNSTSADQVNVNGEPETLLVVDTDNSIGVSSILITDNKISADNISKDGVTIISDAGVLTLSENLGVSSINKGVEWGSDGRAINVVDNKIEPTEIDIDASLRNNAGSLGLNLSGISAGTYKGTTFDATGRATASSGKVQATEINHSARLTETSGILDLSTTGITAGTYKGLSLDVYGRVTGTNNQILANEISINSSLQNISGVLGVATAPDSSKLGGQLPSYYLPATGTAANSNKLGGQLPSYYLPATGTAANSNKLGGQLPSYYKEYVDSKLVLFTTPYTSSSFDGDSFSATSKTGINLASLFNIPSNAIAVLVQLLASDSNSATYSDVFFGVGPNSTAGSLAVIACPRGLPNNFIAYGFGICACSPLSTIYYQVGASGTGTLKGWIRIWGYLL